jgi:hypothetical protein
MTKNLTHVAAWLLAFALWGTGYLMLDRSAWWLLVCAAGAAVGLIAVFMNEPSPKLSEEEKAAGSLS